VTVQSAAVIRGALVAEPAERRFRCASVLKPLMFWAAATLEPLADDPGRWHALAEPAIVTSENDPMIEVWSRCGAAALLARLAELSGIAWSVEPGGVRPFGRVLIRADELALAYQALAGRAAAGEASAETIVAHMRHVNAEQTFGARSAVARERAIAESAIAVKSGWFCDVDETSMRTHTVTISDASSGGTVVTAVLTAVRLDDATRAHYAQRYRSGQEVLGLHERMAGALVREATRKLITQAP